MTNLPPNMTRPQDHNERMAVVRRLSGWELGDASWADRFILAYFEPRDTSAILDDEMAE